MFIPIPGFLIALVTFPGVIVHEAAHQMMCRLTGTPVLAVCYFRTASPCGYVIHENASTPWKTFWISVAPFLLNSILGLLIALPASLSVEANENVGPLELLLGWLGVSVAMHAFPSPTDAEGMDRALDEPAASWFLKCIGRPTVGVIHLGAALSAVWLDAIYGCLVCFLIPSLVLEALV